VAQRIARRRHVGRRELERLGPRDEGCCRGGCVLGRTRRRGLAEKDGEPKDALHALPYLAHREPVDAYLSAQREDFESKRAAALAADPMFYQKLAAGRRTQVAP